eukprot:g30445.t1
MVGDRKVLLIIAYRAQMLGKTVTESALGLTDVEETTSGVTDTVDQLEQFINVTNTFHPNLKFTWTISNTSFPFLDLSVSISSNHLSTDIYFNTNDSFSCLDYASYQPLSCKNAIPYSQFLRL